MQNLSTMKKVGKLLQLV